MVDGVAHEVKQRVRDLLDDGVVHLDGLAGERGATAFPAARAASRAGRAKRAKSRPIGTMRARVTSERRAAVRRWTWAVSSPTLRNEPRQLGLDLRDVGRDLVHAPGEDVEVVVAVELELGEELGQRLGDAGFIGRCRPSPPAPALPAAAWVGAVLLLEVATSAPSSRG